MAVDDSAPRAAAALLDGRQRATMIAAMAPCQPDALLAASIGHARAHGIELTILFGDATGVLGGGADWGDRLQPEPISVTHAPDVLAQQHRFWAVNSALEVDLLGQVNAEYAAGVRAGSAGGQADFFRAAHLSAGGAAVLAIPARTRSGQTRIVARIEPPHGVCTAAADLDIVVTEYGYVQLSGSTATERASRMISIAHPDDRAALRREWDNGG